MPSEKPLRKRFSNALSMVMNTTSVQIGQDAAKAKARGKAKEEKEREEDVEMATVMHLAMHVDNRAISGVRVLNYTLPFVHHG